MAEKMITGSFFDLIHVNQYDAAYWVDECRFWGEESWRQLMRDMHEIGMDTAIVVGAAFWGRPLFPGYEKTVGRPYKMGCHDPLAACADEADRLGMKMIYGFGFRGQCSQVRDYDGMLPPWPEVWFTWNTAMAQALMEQHGRRSSFGGLYISYEMDFHDHEIELYEKLVKEYLWPAVGRVPLLASPGSLGDHPDIERLPAQVERAGITILAPQDYGGRDNDAAKALELAAGNARGLARARELLKDTGVTLWSNCETFSFEPSPDGRNYCIPGDAARIERQIEMAAPLVEKLICYQYQGIMNRKSELVNIGHPGTDKLYAEYVRYLKRAFPERFKG